MREQWDGYFAAQGRDRSRSFTDRERYLLREAGPETDVYGELTEDEGACGGAEDAQQLGRRFLSRYVKGGECCGGRELFFFGPIWPQSRC